jgi:hypothetical protein
MTVESSSARKTPWLLIGLGVVGVLCLCAIVIVVAVLAFLNPIRSSTTETQPTPIEIFETEPALSTAVPAEETQASANSILPEAAPVGTSVGIGNNMTLTVLDVTRPADDLVANGSVLNTTPPEGEEFVRVDVEVTCSNDAGSTCSFYPTVMKAVLSDGTTRDLQTFLEGVEDWDTTVEIEGGTTEQGFLLFLVPRSESDLVVSYQDIYADEPLYFQLP